MFKKEGQINFWCHIIILYHKYNRNNLENLDIIYPTFIFTTWGIFAE